jgi:RNA recognition motif-containing protein
MKSKAQIKRLEKRAAGRGEEYHYTPPEPDNAEEDKVPQEEKTAEDPEKAKLLEVATKLKKELQEIEENTELKSKDRRSAKKKAEAVASEDAGMPASELLEWYEKNSKPETDSPIDPKTAKLEAAAIQLQKELKEIEESPDLKAKDRRSVKRKAEAIAAEGAGMPAAELLEWYAKYLKTQPEKKSLKKEKLRHDPYVAFIGQLSFKTSREQLFEHVKTQLVEDGFKATQDTVKVRMLTDQKTKKSRGMAFVEVEDPEILYALLKLHQTFLDGRRINVERSAGGGKGSEARKSKISQYRKEQDEYFGGVVDSILSEYKKTGELRNDELDAGVVALCKRHSGPVVVAAVAKYIEGSGRDMDNPSAYLTFLLTKFAEEGIYDDKEGEKHSGKPKKRKSQSNDNSASKRKYPSNDNSASKKFKAPSKLGTSSNFAKSGVDMSISEGASSGGIANIFPSAKRGRGRGYM